MQQAPRQGLRADLSQALLRISRRYRLVGATGPAQQEVLFHPDIFLVGSVDDLLEDVTVQRWSTAITGSGSTSVQTVPKDERWKVLGIHILKSSGTYTFTSCALKDTGPTSGIGFVVFFGAGSTDETFWANTVWPMGKNWSIDVNIDTYSAPGNIRVEAYYYKTADYS